MMNSAIFLTIVIVSGLVPAVSVSQEPDKAVTMRLKGVAGKWFPNPMVDKIQGDLMRLDVYEDKVIPLLKQQLELRQLRVEDLQWSLGALEDSLDLYDEVVDVAEEEMPRLTKRALIAEDGRRAAEEKLTVWWRQPVIWAGVGAAVVIVGQVVFAFVVS